MEARELPRVSSLQPPSVVVGPGSYGAGGSTIDPVVAANSAGMMQGMRLSFTPMASSAPKPVDTTGSLYQGDDVLGMRQTSVFNMGELTKKKRGRPRKYGPDGSMSLALTPPSSALGFSSNPMSDPAAKHRGRPPGSGKKQQLDALVLMVNQVPQGLVLLLILSLSRLERQDIASKIMVFSQQGSRTICVLSANGAISDVTLRQPAISGGTVTYEGRFDIISLSGSFLLTEEGSTRSRSGGLSVALAGSDGRILGGGVAGMLVAATPVQVVVASFITGNKKPKLEPLRWEPSSAPLQMASFGATLTVSPPSEGTSSESSDDPGSPTNQNGGTCDNSTQNVQSAYPSFIGWPLCKPEQA
ncbi:AT-hook protein 1 [Musa troglodytarum]|uniref:AT-hook motif nuclear-localized protein n=1 Tax=Musa troglodytarum TaxID=320322 RepID=A0A9E7JL90_9LILI|nr:AT-hook protein 1 [Musa troglodytarum]